MTKVTITAEADDRFEPGQCMHCPFSYIDNEFNNICALGWYYDECKVEVLEGEDDSSGTNR